MVGVKTGHMTRSITPRGGTLDLPLLWPTALWKEEDRRVKGESRRKGRGEEKRKERRKERKKRRGRWDE